MLGNGGFTELKKFGRWTIPPTEYVARLRRYRDEIGRMDWAAPQDWMFTRPSDSCRDSFVIMVRLIMITKEWVLDADELSQGKWGLNFYEFDRAWESVDDLVPGVGDVLAWARRNGAREGTPFFVDPSGRADVLVNAFWRAPGVRGLKEETQRRYAYSLKVWLDFLAAVDVRWDQATRDVLAMFKQWRLSIEDNDRPVSPTTFYVTGRRSAGSTCGRLSGQGWTTRSSCG